MRAWLLGFVLLALLAGAQALVSPALAASRPNENPTTARRTDPGPLTPTVTMLDATMVVEDGERRVVSVWRVVVPPAGAGPLDLLADGGVLSVVAGTVEISGAGRDPVHLAAGDDLVIAKDSRPTIRNRGTGEAVVLVTCDAAVPTKL
jgi:hypothetical protein